MTTSFLSENEVAGYIADLAKRLESLEPRPGVICVLARSGTALLPFLIAHSVCDGVSVIAIDVKDQDGNRIILLDNDAAELIKDQRVLLVDGAVHSGSTLATCAHHLMECGAGDIFTYALVIKRGSSFVPSLFGLMVNDTDRVYYLLSPLPNNRLQTGSRPPVCGHLRKLKESDLQLPPLNSGVPSMDRVTWADRYFDSQASDSRCTYLLQIGKNVAGYLTINQSRKDGFSIDEVVVDPAHQGCGYGGILLRFADTLARHIGHATIQLLAIEEKVPLYQGIGYRPLRDKATIQLPNTNGQTETYIPMARPILYHVRTEMDQ